MTSFADNKPANVLGGMIAGAIQAPAQIAAALAGALMKGYSSSAYAASSYGSSYGSSSHGSLTSCEIPPPCWEPQPAGDCCFELPPGGTATIRVRIKNCGWTRQVVALTVLGKVAGWMTIMPTALLLDPLERGLILVTIQVPTNASIGATVSAPLIIRGCRDHYSRIEVRVCDCAGAMNCCDVNVDDCADQIHHWYEHFYCPRPCNNPRIPPPRGGTNNPTGGPNG
ncbi:MAG: hypothetical protein ABIP93_15065 [Gemmatimonadaceae bacterium]